jgi:hypothetical protein
VGTSGADGGDAVAGSDGESSGYASSGGAPSREITDDEAEDSDADDEALRSARAGSRTRRTRQVRAASFGEAACTDSCVCPCGLLRRGVVFFSGPGCCCWGKGIAAPGSVFRRPFNLPSRQYPPISSSATSSAAAPAEAAAPGRQRARSCALGRRADCCLRSSGNPRVVPEGAGSVRGRHLGRPGRPGRRRRGASGPAGRGLGEP